MLALFPGFSTGCSTARRFPSVASAGIPTTQPGTKTDYVASPGDQLKISVLRRSDFQPAVTLESASISSTGILNLPLVGDLNVGGKTMSELRTAIERAYARELIEPIVQINVTEARGNKLLVLGEVRNPGSYRVAPHMTALEAVVQAGGFTTDSDEKAIILLRNEQSGTRPAQPTGGVALNLQRMLERAEHRQNVELLPGDILYVPPDYIARSDRFFTFVSNMLAPISNSAGTVSNIVILSSVAGSGGGATR